MHHKTSKHPLPQSLVHIINAAYGYPPMEILLYQFFLVNRTCRLIRDLTQIKLLTTLMTEICGWGAFHTARTAKHFRKFVRIVTQAKKKVWQLPAQNIKLLVPTPPSFSARAHFWCLNLRQHSFNLQQFILKICSNYFKFTATLFNLRQLYFICSNFILFAARFFNLQQLFNLQHVPCGPPYSCYFNFKWGL